MSDPMPVKKDILVDIVDVRMREAPLDFEIAREVADGLSRERLANPILMSCFERRAWRHSPSK